MLPEPVWRGWGMPAEFGCPRRLDAETFVFWLTMAGMPAEFGCLGIGIPRVCIGVRMLFYFWYYYSVIIQNIE